MTDTSRQFTIDLAAADIEAVADWLKGGFDSITVDDKTITVTIEPLTPTKE
jgi:hypothetical protein